MASRKDSKGRVLQKGEAQRKDGRYHFAYTNIAGKRCFIYADSLLELRQKEREHHVADCTTGWCRKSEEKYLLFLTMMYGGYMKEIKITDIEDFRIGQSENSEAGTGCTVIISEKGCAAGVDIRGGGPASRECELLRPFSAAQVIHALVLGGGSTFGLDASGGVLKYLEENKIGYDMGITHIPQVCQSDIFDLTVGDAFVRPDFKMGYEACVNSEKGNYRDGNFGAGCGATVGKWLGMDFCMKSGIGSAAVSLGEVKLGAVVAVNAIGDIYDPDTGKKIAGLLSEDKKSFRSTEQLMYDMTEAAESGFTGNTTIGAVLTNAKLDKIQLSKIASMAHNGYARCIRPVHLSLDGDSIYALSNGSVNADMDMIGTLAARVMSMAIVNAIKSAEKDFGYPAYSDLV